MSRCVGISQQSPIVEKEILRVGVHDGPRCPNWKVDRETLLKLVADSNRYLLSGRKIEHHRSDHGVHDYAGDYLDFRVDGNSLIGRLKIFDPDLAEKFQSVGDVVTDELVSGEFDFHKTYPEGNYDSIITKVVSTLDPVMQEQKPMRRVASNTVSKSEVKTQTTSPANKVSSSTSQRKILMSTDVTPEDQAAADEAAKGIQSDPAGTAIEIADLKAAGVLPDDPDISNAAMALFYFKMAAKAAQPAAEAPAEESPAEEVAMSKKAKTVAAKPASPAKAEASTHGAVVLTDAQFEKLLMSRTSPAEQKPADPMAKILAKLDQQEAEIKALKSPTNSRAMSNTIASSSGDTDKEVSNFLNDRFGVPQKK
jgi:hypothetical protein